MKNQATVPVLPGGAPTELEEAVRDYLVSVDARTRNPRTREFYEYGLERVLLPFCRARVSRDWSSSISGFWTVSQPT